MNNLTDLLTLQSNVKDPKEYILLLFGAFLLSLTTVFAYRKYTSTKTQVYDRSFATTLVLISVIVTAIILTLGTNIAMSLGLVGSLSIIRFRSAVKNPVDLAFLFWTVAIGLTAGSNNLLIGAITCLFLLALMLLLEYFPLLLPVETKLHVLILGESGLSEDKVLDALAGHVSKNKISMRSVLRTKNSVEMVMELKGCTETTASATSTTLQDIDGLTSVSVVNPRAFFDQ